MSAKRKASSSNPNSKKQKVEKPEETVESRTEKLQKKLHHILFVDLRRATKEARTSEHKRLQKKITQAEKKAVKGEEIDKEQQAETQSQLSETKEYDGLVAAQHTFFSKLSKYEHGILKARQELIVALKNLNFDYPAISQASNAPQGKIAARFMSIEQVSKVAKSGVDAVVAVLGDGAKKEDEKEEADGRADEGDENDGDADADEIPSYPAKSDKPKPATDNSALIAKLTGALGGTVRNDENEDEDGQSEAGSDISAPLSGYTSGEASDEDALKDWPDPDADGGSEKEAGSDEEEEDDGGNALLDSLNAGVGYISGGSDDISDAEEKVAPKKNRRGQRARRMILEKKFGRGANHVQKKFEEEKQLERAKRMGKSRLDSGWKGRQQRHSVDDMHKKDLKKDFKKFDRGSKPNDRDRDRGYKTHSKPHDPPKADDEGPLHPSWAAKKAQAEAIAKAPAPTKITFDD